MADHDQAPSLREQKKLETRRALARAAAGLLHREGSDGMTVAAIAEQAGVSPRTFHNYFPRREDALLFFVEDTIRDWREQVEAAPADESAVHIMQRLIAERVNADDIRDSGGLLSLMVVGEHLSYLTGPKERDQVKLVAEGLVEALHRRCDGTVSPHATGLMMVSTIVAGSFAVENLLRENRRCYGDSAPLLPTDRRPSEILEESFRLLRDGFGA
ncbi:MAG: TetR/AcrR family transcriptional regulator [Corynebacterium sp.]|uniref:TetR/AcrR family transcriptional regulator n=1 Tax=Corynebacterium TaxID=1716 RepID=UPI002648E303|nr:TetR/AcrR family transcriptional regulator [Corynebacterium sp.]MDN6281652.1 TetR/AcrR family transcriptional regulator [Corynebacterium sp.]MDN6305036.1 TetR/AcrR family transcriptional regulator [Corynebacterium sp.]MDN6367291.1 TetR/AcrR family transcriptional regulator [Corynebacterium sp.]MDN6376947.1 TetR/AcrR family transcriptional regulator [Corynebacterium sp.]MDN6396494.1 TetR/AcrR family transcriptional regulator [Corynebacterium sp.]